MTTEGIKSQYLDRAVARAYDRERFAGPVGRAFNALEKRALSRMLLYVLRRGAEKLLDIPCGTGRITELVASHGFIVTGADVSPAMIEVARERCVRFGRSISWQCLDLDHLDVADGTYDVVTCIRLFHHLQSDARGKVLQELARVTRRFVIVNVSYSSPVYRLRRRVKRMLGQGVSAQSSTHREILDEAERAGLRVVRRRFVWPLVSEDLVLLLEKR